MSIATQRGDDGSTSLVGNARVSKSTLRVEAYGTIDELIAAMGFARSISDHPELAERTKSIQRELFAVGSVLATAPGGVIEAPVTSEMVEKLTGEVHRLESVEGIVGDWSIPGGHPAASAYDVARTVCRRGERMVVRLGESESVPPQVLAYLNRLSDLLWLFARILELEAGVDSSLRTAEHGKVRWTRAW